jgi:hypothetical protein
MHTVGGSTIGTCVQLPTELSPLCTANGKDARAVYNSMGALGSQPPAKATAVVCFLHMFRLLFDRRRKRGGRLPGEDAFMRLADMEDFVRQAEREAMRGDDDDDEDPEDDDGEGGETGEAPTAACGLCWQPCTKGVSSCLPSNSARSPGSCLCDTATQLQHSAGIPSPMHVCVVCR